MQLLTGVRKNIEFLKAVLGQKKVENRWIKINDNRKFESSFNLI